jgi:hypothetical protein
MGVVPHSKVLVLGCSLQRIAKTLQPSAKEADGGAEEFEVVAPVAEIAGVDLVGTEVFAVAEGG